MGILQNYKEGNMNALRSINYSETRTQAPYVVKDIKDPPKNNDKTIGLQFNKRIDDTSRIAQMLIDRPGLKFIGNQTLLSVSELASKAKAAASKKRGQEGGSTNVGAILAGAAGAAGQVLKVVGSTLAQVPVNGTGTHFVRGFTPDTYIKSGDPSELLGFLGFDGESGASRALDGAKIIPDGAPQKGLESFPINDTYRISKGIDVTTGALGLGEISKNKYSEKDNTLDEFIPQNSDYLNSVYSTEERNEIAKTGGVILPDNVSPEYIPPITSALEASGSSTPFGNTETELSKSRVNIPTPALAQSGSVVTIQGAKETTATKKDFGIINQNITGSYTEPTNPGSIQNFRTGSFALDYSSRTINKETRVGLGDQGKPGIVRTNYTTDLGLSDRINALDILTNPTEEKLGTAKDNARDFIKFRFEIITPEDTTFLFFRAFLTELSDSYTGAWDTTKYLGRAEDLYTYQGFSRSMNIGFKIAAASRQEMKPLYKKMAALASVTAPTYGGDGKFMRGTIARVTVGDYIYEVPGIIESVNYTWNTDYNWEIALQNVEGQADDDMQELPQSMDCSLTFKPIHSFTPEAVGANRLLPYITNPTPNAGAGSGNKVAFIPQ